MKSDTGNFIIHKILNHNVIICYKHEYQKEFILIGKGIGFQKKVGEIANLEFLEKIYEIKDKTNLKEYERLILTTNVEIIKVTEEIISKLETRFGKNYNETLHLSLLDHLNFSLYRYQNNIPVLNTLIEDIETMYSEEYQFAKEMVEYVNQTLGVNLPEGEVGFICMHVYAALHHDSVSDTQFYTKVVFRCLDFVEDELKVSLPSNRIEKQRLYTHLKFAVKRAKEKMPVNNPMNDTLKLSYPKSYQLAESLADMLKREFEVELPDGEIGYLALHIQSILMIENKGE